MLKLKNEFCNYLELYQRNLFTEALTEVIVNFMETS